MTPPNALLTIAAHPRCNELARLVRDSLFHAAQAGSLDLTIEATERASIIGIPREEATIDQVNILDAVALPLKYPHAGNLLGALLALGIAQNPGESEQEVRTLLWLTAHAGIEAFPFLDEAMGQRASALWSTMADLIYHHDASHIGISRSDAIIAANALAFSSSPTATQRRKELSTALRSPSLSQLLTGSSSRGQGTQEVLVGELAPFPRGPVATFFLGLFGWLLLSHLTRMLGRFALQVRRPAQVRITPKGIEVTSKTQLLGKVLREHDMLIPLDGLMRATREVRFPRLGTYAGLLALVMGSYVGVSWFIDGLRSGSFSLATIGVLVVVLGVVLDFVLMSWFPGRKGKCRLVLVPRRGAGVCVGWVDAAQADTMLKSLSGTLS